MLPAPVNAVEIQGLTKRFRRQRIRGGHTTLKTQLINLLTGRRREQYGRTDVTILNGVDLQVPAGKTLGIIGQNGSGKSTLLKILCGIYRPTQGTAKVHGRISALLELGAGFHPDFSGRENIEINGVILGLSRTEIRRRMDEIIAFSELEEFIDQPVRTYSSGMFMRLAFSVATFVDPDVLIVDEILSVGDEHFGRKSRAKMEEFKRRGKTIILVTHELGTVEHWCDLAAWIDGGRIAAFGAPGPVIAQYRQKVTERELAQQALAASSAAPPPPGLAAPPAAPAPAPEAPAAAAPAEPEPSPTRWGNRQVTLERVRLLDESTASVFRPESPLTLELDYVSSGPVSDLGFGIRLFGAAGVELFSTDTFASTPEGERTEPLPPAGTVRMVIERLGLAEGEYVLDVDAHSRNGVAYDYRKAALRFAVRSDGAGSAGLLRLPHRWTFEQAGRLRPSG